MKTGRTMKMVVAVLGGGLVLGTGNCLPDDYWAGFAGDNLSNAVGQILEDYISDAVDVVDPVLDVNQI